MYVDYFNSSIDSIRQLPDNPKKLTDTIPEPSSLQRVVDENKRCLSRKYIKVSDVAKILSYIQTVD